MSIFVCEPFRVVKKIAIHFYIQYVYNNNTDSFKKQFHDYDFCTNTNTTNNVCLNISLLKTTSPTPLHTTTVNPTQSSSNLSTYALTLIPTTVTTTEVSSAADSNDSVEVLENTVDLMTPILTLFASITLIGLYFYRGAKNKKHGVKFDKIKYISVAKFVANVGKVWSQLLFGIVLWIENQVLILDSSLGMLMLLLLFIYFATTGAVSVLFFQFIKESRGLGSNLLQEYAKKNLSLMVIAIIAGGFYGMIDLLQSCSFPKIVFKMPLRDSDKKTFMKWKHLHILLTNGIPQFVFQIFYFIHVDYQNVDQIGVYTFLWSIISIMLSVVHLVAQRNSHSSPKVDSHTHETKADIKIKIESNSARDHHVNCQETVETVIESMIAEYESPPNLSGSTDMSCKCDVFGSETGYQGQKQADLYFYLECTIKHDDGDPNPGILLDNIKSVPEKLTNVK